MKKHYIRPEMSSSIFDHENVITASGGTLAEDALIELKKSGGALTLNNVQMDDNTPVVYFNMGV